MLLGIGTGVALPAIPILAKSFDVPFGIASFVVTAFLIGGLVGTLPTGWLIDRVGRRPILIAGPLLTGVMALMVMTAQTFPELLVYRFLDGWAAQMWLLARLARISNEAGARQRGRQVSWMFGMDNAGMLVGPIVGGFVASALGPRAPFAAYAGLAFLALIPVILLGRETGGPVRPALGGERPPISVREIVLPRLVYFAVAFFSAIARGPIFAGMLLLYAAFAYDLDAASIGILATGSSVISLPIGFLAGWLMDRFGRKVTMVPGFTGVGVALLLVSLTAFLHLPVGWFVAAYLVTVTTQALTGGSVQTIGADVAPPNARGTFLGFWRFTGQVGTSLSPAIFAFFASTSGYGSAFVLLASAALTTAAILVMRVPETNRVSA
jgi:MFS family permease